MKLVKEEAVRRIVTIELTPYEQDVLAAVRNRIGGCPTGPRGVTDKLNDILHSVNADVSKLRIDSDAGAIYFRDDAPF